METNTGYPHNYPHKLKSILEAPEEFSEALRSHLSATGPHRLILYAPSESVVDEKVAATVLVVSDDGGYWLLRMRMAALVSSNAGSMTRYFSS